MPRNSAPLSPAPPVHRPVQDAHALLRPRVGRRGGVLLRLLVPFALILAGLGLVFWGFGGAPRLVALAGFGLMGLGTASIVFLGPTGERADG